MPAPPQMEQGCLTYFPQHKVHVSSRVFSGEEADNAEAEASGPRERHHRQLRAHLQVWYGMSVV